MNDDLTRARDQTLNGTGRTRRRFLSAAASGALGLAALAGLSACGGEDDEEEGLDDAGGEVEEGVEDVGGEVEEGVDNLDGDGTENTDEE